MAISLPRRFRRPIRLLGEMWLVRSSRLFFRDWYLAQNPDVEQARVNPFIHFLRHGGFEGRDPNPYFDSDWYLQQNPDIAQSDLNPLVHYLRYGARAGRDPSPEFHTTRYLAQHPEIAHQRINPLAHYLQSVGIHDDHQTNALLAQHTVAEVLHKRFPHLRPLRVFTVPALEPRVTMVTDSINTGSLFGGVATAIILATLLAKRLGAGLRVITRQAKADAANFRKVIELNGIPWDRNVQFVFADERDDSAQVDIGAEEIFLTTSWWTTWSVQASIPPENIIYLLQEDERMFYPFGDDYLRCAETLGGLNMRVVVNSKLMFDHLVCQGFENIRKNGLWFEPSFPKAHFYREPQRQEGKKNFLFYARPNNYRNLYYRGLEIIDRAILRGIFPSEVWDLHFVGKDLPQVRFTNGSRPQIWQNLNWGDYAALLRRMDVGLCLMYTPHPSYPPLDLAACGAVAVTNSYGSKQSLEQYSKNIIVRPPDVPSQLEALAAAVELAGDERRRSENYGNNSLLDDWNISFQDVLARLVRS